MNGFEKKIHSRYRITDFNIAGRCKYTEENRNSEMKTSVQRCKQKRSKIPLTNTNGH